MHSSATNHSKIYKPSASLLCPRHLWLCREAQAKAAGNSGKHREMPADPQGYSPIAEMPISWTQMTQMTILWTLNFWNTILTIFTSQTSGLDLMIDVWCYSPKASIPQRLLWNLWTPFGSCGLIIIICDQAYFIEKVCIIHNDMLS